MRSVPKTPGASSNMPDIVARVTCCETCCQNVHSQKFIFPNPDVRRINTLPFERLSSGAAGPMGVWG